MIEDDQPDYSAFSLLELFRSEAESQVQILTDGLLALERNAGDLAAIEPLMRAAHSIKGAARIVDLEQIVRIAHVMEDGFVAAQKGRLLLSRARIDKLLEGVDLINRISALKESEAPTWLAANEAAIATLADEIARLESIQDSQAAPVAVSAVPAVAPPVPTLAPAVETATPAAPATAAAREEQTLKVSARSFDHLLTLASEARVTAHAMQPQLQALRRFTKQQQEMASAFEQFQQALSEAGIDDALREKLLQVQHKFTPLRAFLQDRVAEFETYEGRLLSVTQEMLDEVLAQRMRPFRDGVQAFPRLVRDLARELGKEARLEILGEETLVDRDILTRIESPLNHLLRNALDHGMETPEVRVAAGKPRSGTITLEARHSGGMLSIRVADDGQGVDLEKIRRQVVERKMASAQMTADMSSAELLEFLLLPAFSLKETTSEISGRGVGLDVVQATVRRLYGTVQLEAGRGAGFTTQLMLPLSQSIVRAVVVNVAGEAYAFPIAKIDRIMRLPAAHIHTLEDKQFFALEGQNVGLVSAAQLLGLGSAAVQDAELAVVVIGSGARRHALAVDTIHGEHSLAVQPIEAVFGKIRDISAAALLDDGTPVLILDVPDLLVSIDKLSGEGGLQHMQGAALQKSRAKRVLVVDDSLTVREMERKLLVARGFQVDVAVDGMDGWNAVRAGGYDLVVTDIDMPRMDGIELVMLIKKDSALREIPVMIVSYKDRPEDRARGISAGADYYLTKGSFHDETLLDAVHDLIGEAGV